ncbi:efflux RND transporter periplasmic adaptor subunit [Mangrovibacter plantisponsor]|uniref:Membrane fusion protein (Multidrug efflux system)/multidrug efflux system membrane fusion protein n=1 Tax=Mangrovibacter plantisponsor TaxID=451513 RepID=A0A317Q5P5_9ENTR|nr:efflux RND transporter periplasmic adaptor subunit [Mangrovibacter plantisponsor]PWW11748.1 membrane fusion protein (multidrug efflux system)/multidrug efflux system membrane fusion protein [Mangrovibacter plantisponsor]
MKKYGVNYPRPALALSLLTATVLLVACDGQQPGESQTQAVDVGVTRLSAASMPVTTTLPGRIVAYRTAEVRPQVSGIVLKRFFTQGSDVSAGDVLYQIDPAPYEAALKQAQGSLAQARAQARISHITLSRYQKLLGARYVSRQEYDQASATAQQDDASVVAVQAAVKSAQINLERTKVTAPVSGRIGRSLFTEGTLVQDGQSDALATISQIDRVYLDMTQPSNAFLALRQANASGQVVPGQGKAKVDVLVDGHPQSLHGQLDFSDVTVDETTGAITLRATILNPQHSLLPGMFVKGRVDEGIRPDALLVPQEAVTHTPRGDASVWVVDNQNKAETRQVDVEQALGDNWLVSSGLKAGETVVVSGVQKLRPGVLVKPQPVDTASQANQE